MAILTYPLNGVGYNAADAETYLCTRTSGVYSDENNFSLNISGNMQVSIGKGIAWINNEEFAGKVVANREEVVLSIPAADSVLNRKDRVVIQFSKSANATSIVLKKGTPASNAVAPSITQTASVFELGLYVINVPAGASVLTAGNITNTMLDENVCGLMRDSVTGIPTATLYAQAENLIQRIETSLAAAISGSIMPHAVTHSATGSDPIAPEDIGAVPEEIALARSGAISLVLLDNRRYTFTNVTSLNLTASTVKARGFITFANSFSAPKISAKAVSGDDISEAAAGETWEFDTENGFIIFKNWGVV